MLKLRGSDERGRNRLDWLDSRFTFSFDRYYDPEHMGFGHLRVLNEDWVLPRGGFPMHPHRDMEIVTYILEGALAHKDSMGNGAVIKAGVVQRMTAGTGIMHSEFNPSDTDTTHLLQIWIHPREKGLTPGYEEKVIHGPGSDGSIRLVASPDARDGSVTIQQDLDLFAGRLGAGKEFRVELSPGSKSWVQIAKGSAEVNGTTLQAGDGAAIWDEAELLARAVDDAELLVFDMNA
jgi:redox-sensitive bicupin YhaK (pirin superfamily)